MLIFNASNLSFTLINDELINNTILTEDKMGTRCLNAIGTRCLNANNNINTDIVDDILSSFVPQDIKHEYKKLLYNILVKQVDNRIIFNDYNDGHSFIRSIPFVYSVTKIDTKKKLLVCLLIHHF